MTSAPVTFVSGRTRGPTRLPVAAAKCLLWLALGFAAGIALSATVPVAFGHHTLVVLSGSMEPTLGIGDLVVDDPIRPAEAHVGDIVTFREPDRNNHLITHRVRSVRPRGDRFYFVTKGDANSSVEKWNVAARGDIGRVEYRIPKLGYVTSRIGSRFGRLALIVLPALLLGVFELARIWRRDPRSAR